MSWPQVFNE